MEELAHQPMVQVQANMWSSWSLAFCLLDSENRKMLARNLVQKNTARKLDRTFEQQKPSTGKVNWLP